MMKSAEYHIFGHRIVKRYTIIMFVVLVLSLVPSLLLGQSSANQGDLERLIALGEEHFSSYRYTLPVGEEANALGVFRRVLEIDPVNAIALKRLKAMEDFYLRKLDQAEAVADTVQITRNAEKVLLINPSNEHALAVTGKVVPERTPAIEKETVAKSTATPPAERGVQQTLTERLYVERQAAYPPDVMEALKKARAFYEQRSGEDITPSEQSIAAFKELLARWPDNYDALWEIARMYWWYGDHLPSDKREQTFAIGMEYGKKATEVKPDGAEGHYWSASLTGKYGEARGIFNSLLYIDAIMKSLQRVIELDPQFSDALAVIGVVYRDAPPWPVSVGDLTKAQEFAEKAVATQPSNVFAQLELGICYNKMKAWDKAKVQFQHVIDMPFEPQYIPEDTEYKAKAKDILMMIKRRGY